MNINTIELYIVILCLEAIKLIIFNGNKGTDSVVRNINDILIINKFLGFYTYQY